MNNQIKQRVSSRVADYFLVVGAGDELRYAPDDTDDDADGADSSVGNDGPTAGHVESPPPIASLEQGLRLRYKAEVLSRYPVADRHEFPLPAGIPLFCLPSGLQLCRPRPPTFHSFVHTSENGLHIMGCCLTMYEPLTASQRASLAFLLQVPGGAEALAAEGGLSAPLCLCVISHWPFVPSFKAFLCGLYRLSLSPDLAIPVERYICNFIDEVPSPPAGRVDVTYYLGEQAAITFRCPPANEPNVWSGLPLSPLFECLSPDNVLALFALVLTERQVIFVSSQYSLLTACAEATTSLMYPLTWTHAYIPVLPKQLLAVLGAPFPFMVGVHTSFLGGADCKLPADAAVVDLDKGAIAFGKLGPPPPLPDRPGKKLMQALATSVTRPFEQRPADWAHLRLPFFDDAFKSSSSASDRLAGGLDEAAVRSGFLKFFVAILKSYRKYIVYGTSNDPDPLTKFRFDDFLAEQPADARPFLEELLATQMFSQFVDERALQFVSGDKLRDVVFFDESIDAKMNRYMFKLHNIDTPFLLDTTDKHAKTYVPPTPNADGLPAPRLPPPASGSGRFCRLDPALFSAPRKLPASLDAGLTLASAYQLRLKRNNKQQLPMPPATAPPPHDHDGSHLSALGCTYSCYLVTVALLVCHSLAKGPASRRHAAPTTQRIIEEYAPSAPGSSNNSVAGSAVGESPVGRERRPSTASSTGQPRSRSSSAAAGTEDFARNAEPAKLGLKVCFEVMSSLGRFQEAPDDVVYRALADACGAAGCAAESVDLLAHLADEGFLPDNQMLAAVARAFAVEAKLAATVAAAAGGKSPAAGDGDTRKLSTADIWNTQDWSKVFRERSESTLYLRKRDVKGALATAARSLGLTATLNVPSFATSPRATVLRRNNSFHNGSGKDTPASPPKTQTAAAAAAKRAASPPTSGAQGPAGAASPPRSRPPPPTPPPAASSTSAPAPSSSSSSSAILKSFMSGDGLFPDLQWADLASPARKPPFAISKRLNRHVLIAERLLETTFPGLRIDLANPLGVGCPNAKCPAAGKPLGIADIYRGFTAPSSSSAALPAAVPGVGAPAAAGDPNKYTTRCRVCGGQFVPRFTVQCDAPDWIGTDTASGGSSGSTNGGSDSNSKVLWCELLSPWALRKEMFTVLFRDGVAALLSPDFRASSTQRAVLFWNAIIAFRVRGLPYAFMLTPADHISAAFPLRSEDGAIGGGRAEDDGDHGGTRGLVGSLLSSKST